MQCFQAVALYQHSRYWYLLAKEIVQPGDLGVNGQLALRFPRGKQGETGGTGSGLHFPSCPYLMMSQAGLEGPRGGEWPPYYGIVRGEMLLYLGC